MEEEIEFSNPFLTSQARLREIQDKTHRQKEQTELAIFSFSRRSSRPPFMASKPEPEEPHPWRRPFVYVQPDTEPSSSGIEWDGRMVALYPSRSVQYVKTCLNVSDATQKQGRDIYVLAASPKDDTIRAEILLWHPNYKHIFLEENKFVSAVPKDKDVQIILLRPPENRTKALKDLVAHHLKRPGSSIIYVGEILLTTSSRYIAEPYLVTDGASIRSPLFFDGMYCKSQICEWMDQHPGSEDFVFYIAHGYLPTKCAITLIEKKEPVQHGTDAMADTKKPEKDNKTNIPVEPTPPGGPKQVQDNEKNVAAGTTEALGLARCGLKLDRCGRQVLSGL